MSKLNKAVRKEIRKQREKLKPDVIKEVVLQMYSLSFRIRLMAAINLICGKEVFKKR